jgi:exodeoxyribonuclease V alpha subunit
VRPVRLVGTRLYLDRYWREERLVAAELLGLAGAPLRSVDVELLADGLSRLFTGSDEEELQRVAAACAVLRRLAVVAGGPGTGKTTTAARVLALLIEQAHSAGRPAPLIALAAPTGKAAARLAQVVHEEASRADVSSGVRGAMEAARATTIHALLGWRPGARSRMRHTRANRLPHDVVIIDETSMVPLTMMARLLEALREDARLLLVGDPDQLSAIEAGAVLRDIVGPAARALRLSAPTRAVLTRAIGQEPAAEPVEVNAGFGNGFAGFGDGIVVLDRLRRFGPGIAALARAIRDGDEDAAIAALEAGGQEVTWIASASPSSEALAPLRDAAVAAGARVIAAARDGDAAAALAALGAFRLLCAHRHGPAGVSVWSAEVERWLAASVAEFERTAGQYAGRPLLITRTDHELRLHNGDVGVVITTGPGRLGAAFERDGRLVNIAPSRIAFAQTLHAMTIHKSQGSQFDVAGVVLGDASSRLLTRELLYTAVTRARSTLIVVAAPEAIRAAVSRPAARASALGERLWGAEA